MEKTNRFGTGDLTDIRTIIKRPICVVSTACLSVTSDMQSYIEDFLNGFFVKEPNKAKSIIILGCQVTDLAILNDIRTAEKYHELYSQADIYMGGCLAQRFDIALPEWCKRLDVARSEYRELRHGIDKVKWEAPFWTDDEGVDCYGEKSGSLFRNSYPLKIGAGCHGKCKYCTIRDTRGETYATDAFLQIKEFLDHADDENGVVLVSDSPTAKQIKDWCFIAERYSKPISFRNVEPHIALECCGELAHLAQKGLLKIFHCPIQSNNKIVLKTMNRDVNATLNYINTMVPVLRELGVYVATNIIIDYKVRDMVYHNMDKDWLNEHFDYWVWNPYFNGVWNREKAEERFKKYINV